MRNAFSLMEMMVVLLIVAIVAAATAPMVTKKMARNAGSGDSPWVFTGLGGNIAYNMGGNDNTTVLIGTTSVPNGWAGRARLFVDSGNNAAHIAFGNGNQTPLLLTADPAGRVGLSNAQIPSNSVAFGSGQTIPNTSTHTVAIGQGAIISGDRSVAVGFESTATEDAVAIGARMARSNADMDRTQATGRGAIAIGQGARSLGSRSVAIGTSNFRNNQYQSPLAENEGAVAIGANAQAFGTYSIALGASSGVTANRNPHAFGNFSVAIGPGATTGVNSDRTVSGSVAIGQRAQATARKSVAIGPLNDSINNSRVTSATHQYSTAIGSGAQTTAEHQIVLGTDRDTVYIPGHLVAQDVVATRGLYFVDTISPDHRGLQLLDQWRNPDGRFCAGVNRSVATPSWLNGYTLSGVSDRRLKNVGEKYTAGLDELKKLEFFHYTFKKDENKTPMVGVMAQDLQKVFPDAVTKGDDGYLRIRLEDMFYAVINAVKELDSKISQIVENVNNINSKIEEQQKVIDAQQTRIDELEKQNADFEKRLAKLEKKNKIVE